MNRTRQTIPWNKVLAIVLLVGVVGYVLARPTLERWWGIPLPSLTESLEAPERNRAEPNRESKSTGNSPAVTSQPGMDSVETKPADSSPKSSANSSVATDRDPFKIPAAEPRNAPAKSAGPKFELKKLDKGRLESPAGLIYSPGPQGEHRVDHVMRHARDEPGRPQHGVFIGSRDEILKLIDDAFRITQQNPRQVSKQADGNRTEYTVRFDRAIGYEGGRSGMRNNFPKVNRLRLVLEDGNDVVTAYPVK